MENYAKSIIDVAENSGWSVNVNGNEFEFEKYSPAGHDFIMVVEVDSLKSAVNEMESKCCDFDCSEETYLYLDSSGHGKNGAPYDMKDLYEDMECCLEMMKELRDELENLDQ